LKTLRIGIYGQIKFRLGVSQSNSLAIATDPSFIVLILGLITMVVSFNGAFGFFRGNTLMLKFFAWILGKVKFRKLVIFIFYIC
jgi:hypothetical protein